MTTIREIPRTQYTWPSDIKEFNAVLDKHAKDTGCFLATAVLGRETTCTKCPFMKCIKGDNQYRRPAWVEALKVGFASGREYGENIL